MREKKLEIEEIMKCSGCGSNNIKKDDKRAEIYCEDCGLVLESALPDFRPARSIYDKEISDKKTHTGLPETYILHDKGLSTIIDGRNEDCFGNKINRKNVEKMWRNRLWQKRMNTVNAEEKTLIRLIREVNRLSSNLGLPRNIRERTSFMCRKAVKADLIRGRTIESIAGACTYAACIEFRIPRTLKEIAEISESSKKEIGKTFRFLSRNLGLKTITSSTEFVSRICNKLGFDPIATVNISNETIKILQENKSFKGRKPSAAAGGAIYVAIVKCGYRRIQKEVAEAAGVTEVTIRNVYKPLVEEMNISHLFK